MGSLRFLLALAVVAFHAGPVLGLRGMGSDAVPAFFILSGLYMALILETKYRDATLTFYGNRLLRLFPMYWAFLLVIVAIAAVPGPTQPGLDRLLYTVRMQEKAATESWLAAIPNLLMIGSDWLRQIHYDPTTGTFHWWLRTIPEGPNLYGMYHYLAVPQIWSLGVELIFYGIAPALVLLRTRTLVVLCAAFCLFGNELTAPLAYAHMLPNVNFWFFLLGMIVYRSMHWVAPVPRPVHFVLAAIPFAVSFAWPMFKMDSEVRISAGINVLLFVFALGLPSLFLLAKDSKTDRWLGELSYPIYITHFLFAFPAAEYGKYAGLACLLASVAMSVILLIVVQAPIDRFRAQWASAVERAGQPRLAGK